MGRLALSLLGPMWVTRDLRPVDGFEYDKVRALLVYLALEADRPHRREMLAGLLWPEQPEKIARDNLRNALATLRRAIGDVDADPPYLFITREAVQFNADSDHTLDVVKVTRQLEQADRHRHRNPDTCRVCAAWRRETADLYRGPLLAQFSLPDSPEFEYWLLNRREQLHRGVMDAFQRLADYYLLRDDNDAARFFAGRQLAYEPWHEGAHRQVMLALARKGDRGAALMQYQACVRALDEELNVKPEAETVLLFERIRDGALSWERIGHTLAAPIAPLIGRERDLRSLGHQLADPDVRLITIVGLGGIGKTSLAREAGRQFGHDFTDGAIFVSLVAAVEPADIFPAIAAAAGLRLEPSSSPLTQVVNYLRSREMLLILDNFEHVTAGASELLDLMADAPRLVLLVTSRQRLGLSVEWLHELRGLDFPIENTTHPLAEFTALQLFTRRVRQERSDFALVPSEALAAADICRLVQGLPLAIELAAAAASARSPAEVARQLQAGMDALAVEWSDMPPRHRSLQTLMDWSYDLLSPAEQRLLRRLSVFAGGFTPAAAEAICDPEGEDNTLESLTRLAHKSLVAVDRESEGETRYGLHEITRRFAGEQLTAGGKLDATMRRLLAFLLDLARRMNDRFRAPDRDYWLGLFEPESVHVGSVFEWGLSTGIAAIVEQCLALSGALLQYWNTRGLLNPAWRWTKRSLEAARRLNIPPHAQGTALITAASIALIQTEVAESEAYAASALSAALAAGDTRLAIRASHLLGLCAFARGELEAAGEIWEEALRLAESIDAPSQLAAALDDLGNLAARRGEFEQALELHRRELAVSQAAGDLYSEFYAVINLGEVSVKMGRPEAAEPYYHRALELSRAMGDLRGQALVTLTQAKLMFQLNRRYEGHRLLRDVLRLSWKTHNLDIIMQALTRLLIHSEGDLPPEARARLGGALASMNERYASASLPVKVEAISATHALLTRQMDAATLALEWEIGRSLSWNEVVNLALETGAELPDPIGF